MEAKELIVKLKESGLSPEVIHHGEWDEFLNIRWDDIKNLSHDERINYYNELLRDTLAQYGIGEFEEVDTEGGHEGQGEKFYMVVFFKEHDIYLRVDGNYFSYDGITNLSPWYEVEPKQITVTVYEAKNKDAE